jgi:quinol monooxygenase YgiN
VVGRWDVSIPHLQEVPVSIVATLELRLRPDQLEAAPAVLEEVLAETRAFAGNLGVEVLTDVEDPTHVTAFERWESLEHDAAYRTWRAGDGRRPALAALLAAPPVLTHWDTSGD